MKYRIVIDGSGTIIEAENENQAFDIGKEIAIQAMRIERLSDDTPTTKEVL